MHHTADWLAIGVLTLILLVGMVLHEIGAESGSIRPVIRAMVEEEFRLRYRAIPVINNPKYVTIYNGGREIVVEE